MTSRYNLIAGFVGVLCGLITTFTFFNHSWFSIFLWGGVALVITYFSPHKKTAAIGGALYGFLTIATWLATAFRGSSDKILQLILIIIIAGAIGAAAGALGSFVSYIVIKKFKSDNKL